MKAHLRLHVICASYGALLAGMNWFRSAQYSRTTGVTAESIHPVAGAVFLSACVAGCLAILCWRAARARLESGRKVAEGKWIRSWLVIVYALPLLWHQSSTSTSRTADGATETLTAGYGHELSSYIFLFAVVGMILFQILGRLRSDDETPNPPSAVMSGLDAGASRRGPIQRGFGVEARQG